MSSRINTLTFGFLLAVSFCLQERVAAQDTLRINFDQFVRMATDLSPLMQARTQDVELARNRVRQVNSSRILPGISLNTAHGLVPGVKSTNPDVSPGRYYLDPELVNNWEDWGIFTQAEISGIQPLYTWGAMSNLVKAAEKGVEAARYEYSSLEDNFQLQLFELYQSALLSKEIDRLIQQASDLLQEAENELDRLIDEGNPEIEEKDIFEFQIYQVEFRALETEAEQLSRFIRRSWNHLLFFDDDRTVMPVEVFLDPSPVQLQELKYYQLISLKNRVEIRQLAAARQAASYGRDAIRAQYFPSLFVGFSAGMGYTPNRPRQSNPFIRNNTNFMSVRAGFGFQQNLNFLQTRTRLEQSDLQMRQIDDYHDAAVQAILIELSDRFREAQISESRRDSRLEALRLSNEWLRIEQIDFDLGFGNIKNLIDAVKKKMELELEVIRLTFDHNLNIARLYHTAGLPVSEVLSFASDSSDL